jgi:predicted  nucleic acid-binding Zn-ribbon protein
MKESLYKLLELQEIDNEIDALEKIRRDYPSEITRIDQEMDEARRLIQEQRMKREDLEKSQRFHERELTAAMADLKKHQDRLYEVKTNREYDALQVEIEACRGRVTEQENGVLTAEESLEALIPRIQSLEEEFAQGEAEKLKRKEELEARLRSIDSEVQQRRERWETVRLQVIPQAIATYTRLRKGKSGLAVVRVSKGACGGCFREIPPQKASEVRRNNRLIPCESCGRLLVSNGN